MVTIPIKNCCLLIFFAQGRSENHWRDERTLIKICYY